VLPPLRAAGSPGASNAAPDSEAALDSDVARDCDCCPSHAVSVRVRNAIIIRRMMIIARNLSQTYRSGLQPLTVLRDVDLDIAQNEFVAILGPSGSGTTTLLGLLAGLDTPATGTVQLAGAALNALGEDDRARFRAGNIGFVFQTFQLVATLTALENVLVPLELAGAAGSAAELTARARALLERVGLGDRTDHYPQQLSGGEQQRVALARAFASEPKILFADEPTGNLDSETGGRIIDLLVRLNEESATTLVLVTHDLELARRAGRVIRLAAGRIISDERQA
jgi:putative ABC transport system ATP-binding protein